MDDADLIARVYPETDLQTAEWFLKRNSSRRQNGLPRSSPRSPDPGTHDGDWVSTRPSSETGDQNPDDFLDCLELRFSDSPKTDRGFVFGLNQKCDVLLPTLSGISNFHFTITFENDFFDTNDYRLVLRDLGSRSGTKVSYDGHGNFVRRRFRWILSGHSKAKHTTIRIELPKGFTLRIVVSVGDISETSPVYEYVQCFLRPRSPDSMLRDLDLEDALQTCLATGANSPSTDDRILIDTEELG
jgi:hypothetical protein